MKDVGDLSVVILIAAIVWVVTAIVVMIVAINVIDPDAAEPISIGVATIAALGFVAFWIKGRSVSEEESRADDRQEVSDFEILVSYGALFSDLDTKRYIYDKSLLPYPKEQILSAAIRVLEREDSPGPSRLGAVLAKELSQFQAGVGSTPQSTEMSLRLDRSRATYEGGINEHIRAIRNRKKSEVEIRAERERRKIVPLVSKAFDNNKPGST